MKRTFIIFHKVLVCLLLMLIAYGVNAQTYNIRNNHGYTYTTCSGTLYDSGGPTGNYGNNENYHITFCSANPGEEIFISLQIDTENTYDFVRAYNGPTTASPLLGTWSGTQNVTVNSTNGCLTIRFTSDGSVNRSGFVGTIACGTPPPPPPPPPATTADCFGAIAVCTNFYTENDISSGIGNISELSSSNNGCLVGNEHNSRWYIFTVSNSGTLTFRIQSTHDYDWALWNMTGHSCWDIMNGTLPMLRCNYSATTGGTGLSLTATGTSEGAGGSPWCRYVDALAGETYVLLVDKFTSSTASYNLDFAVGGGTAGGVYDITPPSWLSINDPYLCGVSTINATFSENIACASASPTDFIVSGPSGTHTVHSVTSPGCQAGNPYDIVYSINFAPPLTQTGTYTIELVGCVDDVCGNSLCSGSFSFNIVGITTNIINIVPANCGMSDGSATATASGGSGNYSYTWSTNPPQNTATAVNLPAGHYSVTISDITGGCTVVDTVTIGGHQIIPNVAVTALPATICPGSSSTLTATGANTYSWSPGTGLSSVTGSTVVATPPQTTTYTVTGVEYGCSNTATVTITVLPLPTVSITPPVLALCPNETGSLTASGASAYEWTPQTYLSSTVGASVSVTPSSSMIYFVTGTDANGCINSASVTVNMNPPAAVNIFPTTAYICPSNAVTINASGLVDYTWSPPLGLNTTSGSQVIASPSVTTTYTVTGSNVTGCPGTDYITVFLHNAPAIAVSPDSSSVCSGNPIALAAVGADTYVWTPATGLSATSGANVVATPVVPVTYTVTGTDANACTGSTTAYVNIYPIPQVNFLANPEEACQPSEVQFTDLTDVPIAHYLWNFGDYYSNENTSTEQHPTHTYNYHGKYDVTLRVTSTNGCKNNITKSQYIEVFELPKVDFNYSPRFPDALNSQVFFKPIGFNHSIVNWTWNFGDPASGSENIAFSANPVHNYRDSGTYVVSVIFEDINGCIDSLSKTLYVDDLFALFMPNAFTPDGDDLNDYFCVKGRSIDPEDFSFRIYDRWGSVMFYTEDIAVCWDGRDLNGNPVAQGAYVWMIRLTEMRSSPRRFTGTVTVLR